MSTDSLKIDSRVTEKLEAAGKIVLSGTFTLDSLVAPLELLLSETGLPLPVQLTPYRQVFQELLDPASESARNRGGANVFLVRAQDWMEPGARSSADEIADEFLKLIADRVKQWPGGLAVGLCPSLAEVASDLDARLRNGLQELTGSGLTLLRFETLLSLPAHEVHDPEQDRLANVPYTPLGFAALARDIARSAHARSPRSKVIVLDCDNTLWDGVVGEDGVDGIRIPPARRALHDFLQAKREAGLLLCLATKNVEEDALEVFKRRSDIGIKLHDLVAWKVNWQPKSSSVRELAAELNLGLDSFVFVDDNPVEIAEMQAACPEVLSLHLPIDEDYVAYLGNVWPLDVHQATEEDRRRTELYRENVARERFAKSTSTLSDFLTGLGLQIDIHPPQPDQVPRAAQLTQRTNQFNFTTRRRTEAELEKAMADGLSCRVVEVSDRFGDYGLVGLVLYAVRDGALEIDTFLLSCRVLGRGVEHAMVRELGRLAETEGATRVEAPFRATSKNQPASKFLATWPAERAKDDEGFERFVISSEVARQLRYQPDAQPETGQAGTESVATSVASSEAKTVEDAATVGPSRSVLWNRFAREHATPHATLSRLRGAPRSAEVRTAPLVEPRNATEAKLRTIWQDVLGVPCGIDDNYFELGGTSLLAVNVFARIERELGVRLPLALLVECPTIASLAARMEQPRDLASLVTLSAPSSQTARPLFLVHDADGETLLYRNLARRLGKERPIYALQPRADAGAAIVHTSIEEMARHYVTEMRKVQPFGPFLLGGLCAGGVLAYEMARQLELEGETAHLVALFDAADVEAAPRPHLETSRRLARVRDAVKRAPLHALPKVLAGKALRFSAYGLTTRLKTVREKLSVGTLRFCLEHGLPLPSWARALTVRAVYNAAEAAYRPRHKVREEIVLFRATSGEGIEEPYRERYADADLGWSSRTAKRVHIIDVPGGHGSMLQEPNVEVVASWLRAYLDGLADERAGDDEARWKAEKRSA